MLLLAPCCWERRPTPLWGRGWQRSAARAFSRYLVRRRGAQEMISIRLQPNSVTTATDGFGGAQKPPSKGRAILYENTDNSSIGMIHGESVTIAAKAFSTRESIVLSNVSGTNGLGYWRRQSKTTPSVVSLLSTSAVYISVARVYGATCVIAGRGRIIPARIMASIVSTLRYSSCG